MYALMIYSLKVGVCLAVFYLFFKLLLSRETFHRFNRFVVLGAMVLSFVLPLCVITVYREVPVVPGVSELPVAQTGVATSPETASESFPWEMLAGAAFLAGAAATFVWMLCSLAGVLRLICRGRRERLGDGAVLVRTERAVMPFSWGRYIVMSEKDLSESGGAVLLHECAHLRLRHTADLIVTDLAGCLQWFNPAMWLLRRELRAIHEYEADAAVLDSGVDAKSYQMLLIRKAVGGRWYSVANSFNHSKLKNRITMMLCKRSSRWAGARALLLLPLTAVALGAFAQTAYVFPEDKGTKENVTIRMQGTDFSSDGKHPLLLVEGKEVKTLDSLSTGSIESITVLKDSMSAVTYGERGKDGVILVRLKKADKIPGQKGNVVKIVRTDTSGTNKLEDVRVIGYGTVPKNATAESMLAVVMKGGHIRINGSEAKPAFIVDGVQVDDLESLDKNQIERISVLKGKQIPEPYRLKGYDGVIKIMTKQGLASCNAAIQAAREKLEASAASIGAARKGMERARKYMSAETWEKTREEFEEARKEHEAALKEAAERLAEAQKAMEMSRKTVSSRAVQADRVTVQGPPENSVSVYKGRVTLKGRFPDDMLVYINGKKASKEDAERLEPGKIKRMQIYKGAEAVKRFGEAGRNGAVEIRARK